MYNAGFFIDSGRLTGQLLVAMPTMPDLRFARSVVYICSHGDGGSMGLVVNRLYGEISFQALLHQLNLKLAAETPEVPVHFGGPVEVGRGFVLHSTDYLREGTMRIDDNVALSATVEILEAISQGQGPERLLMALGYTGWGAGQLDAEVQANGWLTAPADEDILFGSDIETKYDRALAKIGITSAMLSGEVGHA